MTLVRIQDIPGFDPELLRCSAGHDHGQPASPLVWLVAERAPALGRQSRGFFHCPACGLIENARSDRRSVSGADWAMALGEALPCATCLPALRSFLMDYLRSRRR
ncbi:MAG: hypothetical protein A3G27_05945 [Betaproteobacteria bacterium RIFCSPLOWO2_12_FULL_66_14]|nr:MAG: hypothetical protein A3G27_05945 [Betaproteobacteria bacterium RIFCSPLOWO2_12_FULL_66_14]